VNSEGGTAGLMHRADSKNKKFQITNTKQITMTEIQNSKQLAFELI
jgi:hypothetical protein